MAARGELGGEVKGLSLSAWQSTLLDQMMAAIRNYYCLPEKLAGTKEKELEQKIIAGFSRINAELPDRNSLDVSPSTKTKFVTEINNELKNFDPHLTLFYNPQACKWLKDKIEKINNKTHAVTFNFDLDTREIPDADYQIAKNKNFYFEGKPEIKTPIPENVGYLHIKHFLDPRWGKMGLDAQEKVFEILLGFKNKNAIIFDVRDSSGGSPEMVQYILSFFLKKGTPINTIENFLTKETRRYDALETVDKAGHPFKLLDVPIYVISDKNTFSASEEFAYDVQQIQRATGDDRFTLVGEVTVGGAHPTLGFPLVVDPESKQLNQEFFLSVPYRNAKNPYSHTNWEDQEKKGVQPDVVVPATEALEFVLKNLVPFDTLIRALEHEIKQYKNRVPTSATKFDVLERDINSIKEEKLDGVTKLNKLVELVDVKIKELSSYSGLRLLDPNVVTMVCEKALRVLPPDVLFKARKDQHDKVLMSPKRMRNPGE